ncbi:MAG: S8 family serine peptidase, partial [Actinobacteria bacterium]|nr:S8 family serine peptidase [Actinomycetota bacterium]
MADRASKKAARAGVVVVFSAGNASLPVTDSYGGSAVIVAATGRSGQLASYSQRGSGVDLAAPGGDPETPDVCTQADCVTSLFPGNRYSVAAGTSMAAPHVSGVAALLLGSLGSWLLARRLKRQTFGLEPAEIGQLLEQREHLIAMHDRGRRHRQRPGLLDRPHELVEDLLDVGGAGQDVASRSVSDVAGNTTNTTVASIRIDRTAPSTSVDVPKAPDSGWYAGDVKVTLTGIDALSKVDKTYYSVGGGAAQVYSGPFDHALKGVHTITFWSVDKAGNVEDRTAPGHSITLKIDGTPPSIKGNRTPANGFGWNNDDVTVSFDCNDNESGIAGCTPPVTLTNAGEGQSVTGHAIDVAGNRAQDTVGGINIDRTAPSLIGAPTTNANGAGWYRGDVNVQWTADDGLSGIDPSTVP